MKYTGKAQIIWYKGRTIRLLNQSCAEWTHPYIYEGEPSDLNANLHDSGCGIFSVAHVIDWQTGEKINVEELADFSFQNGGRGDDGTDRPALLAAMERAGRLKAVGLNYQFEGLVNDPEALWQVLTGGGGALCDLRVGHIVAVVDCRVRGDAREVLVIDSSYDSIHYAVREKITEVIQDSLVAREYKNAFGVRTGMDEHYGMYWVPFDLPYDVSLMHKIS